MKIKDPMKDMVDAIKAVWPMIPPVDLPECFKGWQRESDAYGAELHTDGLDLNGRRKNIVHTRRALYAVRLLRRDAFIERDHELAIKLVGEAKAEVLKKLAWQYKYGNGKKNWTGRKYWQPVCNPKTKKAEDKPEQWFLWTLGDCPMFIDDDGILPRALMEDGYELRVAIYGNFFYLGRSGKSGEPPEDPMKMIKRVYG